MTSQYCAACVIGRIAKTGHLLSINFTECMYKRCVFQRVGVCRLTLQPSCLCLFSSSHKRLSEDSGLLLLRGETEFLAPWHLSGVHARFRCSPDLRLSLSRCCCCNKDGCWLLSSADPLTQQLGRLLLSSRCCWTCSWREGGGLWCCCNSCRCSCNPQLHEQWSCWQFAVLAAPPTLCCRLREGLEQSARLGLLPWLLTGASWLKGLGRFSWLCFGKGCAVCLGPPLCSAWWWWCWWTAPE